MIDSGKLARFMYKRYEEIAREEGFGNKEKIQVDFDDLPLNNREVILRLAEEIVDRGDLKR